MNKLKHPQDLQQIQIDLKQLWHQRQLCTDPSSTGQFPKGSLAAFYLVQIQDTPASKFISNLPVKQN
jgi:hypothetical protein